MSFSFEILLFLLNSNVSPFLNSRSYSAEYLISTVPNFFQVVTFCQQNGKAEFKAEKPQSGLCLGRLHLQFRVVALG